MADRITEEEIVDHLLSLEVPTPKPHVGRWITEDLIEGFFVPAQSDTVPDDDDWRQRSGSL